VDALSAGSAPGTTYRFDARTEPPPAPFRHRGSHTFGVADVLELARALGRLPERVVVYGIEGGSFGAGVGLSADVARAAGDTAERVLAELAGGEA
jgi:hydrogenase maturation protease